MPREPRGRGRLAIVFATYNRVHLLVKAVDSMRRAAFNVPHDFVIVDGGSTDGTREWLSMQKDVVFLGQQLPLTGAVDAFNLAFGYVVDHEYKWVLHGNDDIEFQDSGVIQMALGKLESDPHIGAVAFEHDLWDRWGFDCVHGKTYSNYGIIKTEVGKEAARAMGDSTGRAWWNPLYRTYGADSELGVWIWKLGYRIEGLVGMRVHDASPKDELREKNQQLVVKDREVFWSRWKDPRSMFSTVDKIHQDAKLHLCCGTHKLEGWVNVDGIPGPNVDVVFPLSDLDKLPAGRVTRVYWSHGPEHVYPDLLPAVLAQLKRICVPGSEVIIATIDLDGVYQNRYKTHANGSAWNAALYGECDSKDHPYLAHRQCFTQTSLSALLQAAGFRNTRRWQPEEYPEILALNDYATSCRLVTCHVVGVA